MLSCDLYSDFNFRWQVLKNVLRVLKVSLFCFVIDAGWHKLWLAG